MKEVIKEVRFVKEIDGKFGKQYMFEVQYDNKRALYYSRDKEQKTFEAGKEAEFTEEEKSYEKNGETKTYYQIKAINPNKQSPFGKALKKEQTRYSGFAVSYAKDLCVSGKIKIEELETKSWDLFKLMVAMDKTIES